MRGLVEENVALPFEFVLSPQQFTARVERRHFLAFEHRSEFEAHMPFLAGLKSHLELQSGVSITGGRIGLLHANYQPALDGGNTTVSLMRVAVLAAIVIGKFC